MSRNSIADLLNRFQRGQCTSEEQALVEKWFMMHGAEKSDLDQMTADEQQAWADQLFVSIQTQTLKPRARIVRLTKRKPFFLKIAGAAAVLCLSIIGYLLLRTEPQRRQTAEVLSQIKPGRNQATLTLANGKKIVLTSLLKGTLARQGNTVIQVNASTALAYTHQSSSANTYNTGNEQHNTLSTARGEASPYALILSDGTRVWLNAASSITYPVAFKGSERNVSITGEAYFEVAHNARHPFKVTAKGFVIEDIGTAFNINTYDDEPSAQATLINGSIKVLKGERSAFVKPGEVAIIKAGTNVIKVEQTDTEAALAWKNGLFIFNDETLESIMKKIARWYDVDIDYQNVDRQTLFYGGVSRSTDISKVLRKLELTGAVHFKIAGRRIVVRK